MNNAKITTCNDVYTDGVMCNWALSPTPSRETDKAALYRVYYTLEGAACYNAEVWIPKSILKVDTVNLAAHLPAWFINKNFAPLAR